MADTSALRSSRSGDRMFHCAGYFGRTIGRSGPRGWRRTEPLRLPLLSVERPDDHPDFAHSADLPPALLCELDSSGTVWGHALQPDKQNWLATLSILYWLNELRTAPLRPIRLFLSKHSLTEDICRGLDEMLALAGRNCADYFVRVSQLIQGALFRLMRGCRFRLAYNRFLEPFGFYVLESDHQGCPVYTNVVGNNRDLLPPEHGINVYETFDIVDDARGQREPVAWWVVSCDLDDAREPEIDFDSMSVQLGLPVRGLDQVCELVYFD